MKRPSKATTLLVVFVVSLLLGYIPLFVRFQSLANEETPLNSVYWSFFRGTSADFYGGASSLYGPVSTSLRGPIVFGDLENKSASGGAWDIYVRMLPLLDKNMLARTHAFVAVEGSAPFSMIPAFTVEKVGWNDNFNTSTLSGWQPISYRDKGIANVSLNEGIATFKGMLTDQRDWYSLSSNLPEKISSTEYPYLIVKFKSSAPIAYFGAWDGDVSVACTFSRYAPDWQTVFLKLPSGRNISRVEIGIDDLRYPSISGNQTVEFASIMLASLYESEYGSFQVSLNNYTVVNDKLEWLTEGTEGNFLTINTTDHTLSFSQGRLRFEVPTSLIRDENYLSVSLGGYSTMNITRPYIELIVDYEQPFWRGVDSRIWILGFGIEVIIGFYFIVRLTKWLKKSMRAQVNTA